jgi:hypothetical protein
MIKVFDQKIYELELPLNEIGPILGLIEHEQIDLFLITQKLNIDDLIIYMVCYG